MQAFLTRPIEGDWPYLWIDSTAARDQWRRVADQLRPKLPKLAGFLDAAETDVPAYMSIPAAPPCQAALHQSAGTAQ